MGEFNYGRALAASLAVWSYDKIGVVFFWPLLPIEWLLFRGVELDIIPMILVTWVQGIVVWCLKLAFVGACAIWYFRKAPSGVWHGLLLGFTFSCVSLVLIEIENGVRLHIGTFTWYVSPWEPLILIAVTGLFGIVYEKKWTPKLQKPKVFMVPD